MTWTLHPIGRFSDLASEWDALARSRPGTPFLESAFLRPLLDEFGSGDERLCLYRRDGRVAAAAIVERPRHGMWQTFQPSQLPLGAWITAADVDFAAAAAGLLRALPGLNLGLGLTQLDSRIHQRPADAATVRTQDYIATAWVDLDTDFETYWEARGKNLKQNMRKQRNKLQADGVEMRTECLTDAAAVGPAIEDYGRLESAGWKAADGTAVHPDNAQGRFYRRMLENFCGLGRGRIYRTWFGDKVVAMDLCIDDDEVIVILKTAYDESYKSISPSTLMRQDEFRLLFDERRYRRIEFYGKVMEWHTRWTDKSRPVYHANVYRHAAIRRLLELRAGLRKPAPQPEKTVEAGHA